MLLWKFCRTASIYVLACVGSGLCTKLVFLCMQLCSCVPKYVLEVLRTWEWTCVRWVLSACVSFDLRMWNAWQKLCSAHFYFFFTCFISTCNSHAPSCHFCIRISLYHPFYLHSCITTLYSSNFTSIMNLMTSFLQSSSPYAGRGSTNKVVEWFKSLVPETKGYI